MNAIINQLGINNKVQLGVAHRSGYNKVDCIKLSAWYRLIRPGKGQDNSPSKLERLKLEGGDTNSASPEQRIR